VQGRTRPVLRTSVFHSRSCASTASLYAPAVTTGPISCGGGPSSVSPCMHTLCQSRTHSLPAALTLRGSPGLTMATWPSGTSPSDRRASMSRPPGCPRRVQRRGRHRSSQAETTRPGVSRTDREREAPGRSDASTETQAHPLHVLDQSRRLFPQASSTRGECGRPRLRRSAVSPSRPHGLER
jgi:hypothetical protein